MSNHKIKENDKILVCDRLAQGASLQEAITGTSIKSKSTAAIIARDRSNEIKQVREEYSKLIQDYAFNTRIERARLWAEATVATKRLPLRATEQVTYQAARDGYVSVPDWPVRFVALKYLDMLDGIVPPKEVNLTVMQQFNRNR